MGSPLQVAAVVTVVTCIVRRFHSLFLATTWHRAQVEVLEAATRLLQPVCFASYRGEAMPMAMLYDALSALSLTVLL